MSTQFLKSQPNTRQQELCESVRTAADLDTAVEFGKTLLLDARENPQSSEAIPISNAAHYIRNQDETNNVARELFAFAAQFDDNSAASAINSLCFGWLIPQSDYETADQLLGKAVGLNVGYESLNALSNLGQLRIRQSRYVEAELILAWIRMSNSKELRPEASYFLAHLVSPCSKSGESIQLLSEVANSNDSSYTQLAKDCSRGTCSMGTLSYQITPPSFSSNATLGLAAAFPRFTQDLPYDLSDEIEHSWNGGEFLESLNLHAADLEFGSTLRHFVPGIDVADKVVRTIVSRHIGSCLESNQWPLGLYLLARFGPLDLTDNLALESANVLLAQLASDTSVIACKVLGLAQAAKLELLVRRGDISEASEFVEQTLAFESGEWFYSRALHSLGMGAVAVAGKQLAQASEFGFAPARMLSVVVDLVNGEELSDAEKACVKLGQDFGQSWPNPNEAMVALVSEMRSNLVARKEGTHKPNSPRLLIGEELLALALVASILKDTKDLRSTILTSLHDVPDASVDNFTQGLLCFLDYVDVEVAATDLTRWPRLLGILEEVGKIVVLQALAENPLLVNHSFRPENQAFIDLFRGNAQPSQLLELAKHESEAVQLAVAQDQSVDQATLGVLALSPFQSVQKLVISSGNLGEVQTKAVMADLSSDAQWALASNESTDSTLLEALSNSSSESVRRAVAGNKNTPVAVFEALALDPSWSVRQQVIGNPIAPDSAKAIAALQS